MFSHMQIVGFLMTRLILLFVFAAPSLRLLSVTLEFRCGTLALVFDSSELISKNGSQLTEIKWANTSADSYLIKIVLFF